LRFFGLARYLYVAGLWWRARHDRPIYSLPPSVNRREAASLLMAMFTVLLWPILSPPMTTAAAVVFGIPFSVLFLRDWLVVSGRIDVRDPTYLTARTIVSTVAHRWLPLYARLLAVFLVITQRVPLTFSDPLGWLGALGLVSVALGAAGRVGAIALIALAVLGGQDTPHETTSVLLLICAIVVLSFGSGTFAVWKGEDRLYGEHD
jgi:CDP-diacylglycerol--glycerol-3-phosphate 3-phosphatidyltransferase